MLGTPTSSSHSTAGGAAPAHPRPGASGATTPRPDRPQRRGRRRHRRRGAALFDAVPSPPAPNVAARLPTTAENGASRRWSRTLTSSRSRASASAASPRTGNCAKSLTRRCSENVSLAPPLVAYGFRIDTCSASPSYLARTSALSEASLRSRYRNEKSVLSSLHHPGGRQLGHAAVWSNTPDSLPVHTKPERSMCECTNDQHHVRRGQHLGHVLGRGHHQRQPPQLYTAATPSPP